MKNTTLISSILFGFTLVASLPSFTSGNHTGGHGENNDAQRSENCYENINHQHETNISKGHSHTTKVKEECKEKKSSDNRREDSHGDHQH